MYGHDFSSIKKLVTNLFGTAKVWVADNLTKPSSVLLLRLLLRLVRFSTTQILDRQIIHQNARIF